MKTFIILLIFSTVGLFFAIQSEQKEELECKNKGGELKRFFKNKPLCIKKDSIID